MYLKRMFVALATAASMALAFAPVAQALTASDILGGQVKGDTSFSWVTITSPTNQSIKIEVAAEDYNNDIWTYGIRWDRKKQVDGALRVYQKGNPNLKVLQISPASPTDDAEMDLRPDTSYTIEFYSQADFNGFILVRKSFKTRSASALSSGQQSGSSMPLSGASPIGAGYNQYVSPPGWYPSPNAPQFSNGLTGYSFGPYAGKSLASLGTRTSAPALGSGSGSCSLSNGWTVDYYTAQYGYQFVQSACAALSKELFLYSIDYCTNQTDCFHHDYTGQYKIPRNVLEQALGHTLSTISFDPVTVDPFNPILFTDRSLEAKCVAPRKHNAQLDMYDAGCGTRTGTPTDTPIQWPTYLNDRSSPVSSYSPYAGMSWTQLGTKTSAAPLGYGGYCAIGTSGEAQNWGKDGMFIDASCRMFGLGYKTWLYSIKYKFNNKCYYHDYTGQYEVDCTKMASKMLVSDVPTISAIPGSDGMNRELFNQGFQAQCWALRNHSGQLGGYDAGCGTSTGY